MLKQLQTVLDALENGIKVRNFEGGTKYQPALEAEAISIIKQMMQAKPVAWRYKFPQTNHWKLTTNELVIGLANTNTEPLYTKPKEAT